MGTLGILSSKNWKVELIKNDGTQTGWREAEIWERESSWLSIDLGDAGKYELEFRAPHKTQSGGIIDSVTHATINLGLENDEQPMIGIIVHKDYGTFKLEEIK